MRTGRFSMSSIQILLLFIFSSPFIFAQHYQDFSDAFPICYKQTYQFKKMEGHGKIKDHLGSLSCSKELRETNSIWLTWDVESKGILTFYIDPLQSNDDIDFVLFRKATNSIGENSLEEVRCMAAGTNVGQPEIRSIACKGATGLNYQSLDDFEKSGCKYDSDNFLKFLSTEVGEQYVLLINNYNSSEGFSISFDGDAEMKPKKECEIFNVKQDIEISSIVPNPAKESLTVNFLSISNKAQIDAEIFSINGKRLIYKKLEVSKGMNSYVFNIEDFVSGTYLLRLTNKEYSTIRQFVKI